MSHGPHAGQDILIAILIVSGIVILPIQARLVLEGHAIQQLFQLLQKGHAWKAGATVTIMNQQALH
jgi:hypothetical protein